MNDSTDRDRGSTSLTIVLLAPVMLVLMFAGFQAAMWNHTRTEARVVARETAVLVAARQPLRGRGRHLGDENVGRRQRAGQRQGVVQLHGGQRDRDHHRCGPGCLARHVGRSLGDRGRAAQRMGAGMRRDRDHGEANTLGLVLIAPVAIGLAILILWIGRQVDTNAQVKAASSEAAQAAARQRDPVAAEAAARATAAAMLVDATACPLPVKVDVNIEDWRPGGKVSVTVSCIPQSSDLALVDPGQAKFSATSSASIDSYRSAGLP